MDSTQVLELTQTLEASQATEISDTVPVKVGSLKINGVEYFIWNKENTVGRDEGCDIVIENKAVSVEHAIIEADAFGKHLIWDLGSTNKTRLGEVQLKPRVRHYLKDCARLRFANVNAVYHHIKVTSPQKPPLPEPVATHIPGTPERAEEDAAAVASIVAETPSKDDENDGSSDGDLFGERDSSSLFIRPVKLLEGHTANPDAENHNCVTSSKKNSSLNKSDLSAPSEVQPQLSPVGQVVNESSVCEADTSIAIAGETDTSDVIAGSQPMFTPEKALNIYDVDTVPMDRVEEINIYDVGTVPMDRVEETPVRATKSDELNWEDIDDTIHEISQEMDTIDTLIENKELYVKFTPPKKIADSTSAEHDNASSTAVNSKPPSKTTPPSRNLGSCFEEQPRVSKPQVKSSNSSPVPSCDIPLQENKMSIYDVDTEPLYVVVNKIETGDNIFDLATQEVQGSKTVGLEAETSVYDLATQQFFDTESKNRTSGSDFAVTDCPIQSPENISSSAADVSISDFPTQAAGETDVQVLPARASGDQKRGSIPPLGHKEAASKMSVPHVQIRNGGTAVDNSLCDMLTQDAPAGVVISNGRISESPLKTNAPEYLNVSISHMDTQLSNKRSEVPLQGVTENEPPGHSLSSEGMPTQVTNKSIPLNDDSKSGNLRDMGDISISELATQQKGDGSTSPSPSRDISLSDMLTQLAEKNSCAADADLADVQMQVAQRSDVSLADLQTQVANDHISNAPPSLCAADLSISDLQTQVADIPHSIMPDEPRTPDISISDLQTQVASVPQNEIDSKLTASINIADIQTQLALDPPSKKVDGASGPDSEDIYNQLTQMPVADHQIMCEESNTEIIEQEVDGYEEGIFDSTLRKSSDGSSGSLADSVSPFKTPTLEVEASKISSSDPNDDDVYLLDTQPMHVPVPAHSASGVTHDDGFEEPSAEDSKSIIAEESSDSATRKLSCKPAGISTYDVETQGASMTEEAGQPAETAIYDVETQDVGIAEEARKPEGISVYDVETQDFGSAEQGHFDVDTVPLVGADLASKVDKAKTSGDKDSKEACVRETSAALTHSRLSKHRYSQDLDANSVENRIRAMNDRNENPPAIQKGSLNTKSTVAELLETLEGTPCPQIGEVKNLPCELGLSQNSNAECSQFPVKKSHKKLKVLAYSDSEDSHDPLVLHVEENKPLSGLDLPQSSNARCSQFPVERVHKKVKALAYSDSEDSWDSPLLIQKKSKKPLKVSADEEECAIDKSKEDEKTVVATSPAFLCNGNPLCKEDSKGSRLPKAESPKASVDTVLGSESDKKSGRFTSANSDTGDSGSLRLQLTDISITCSVTGSCSLPVDTKESEETGKLQSNSESLHGIALEVGETVSESRKLREDPMPEKLVEATSKVSANTSCPTVSTPVEERSRDAVTPEKTNSMDNPKGSAVSMPVIARPICISELEGAGKESLSSLTNVSDAQSVCTPPKSTKKNRENISMPQPNTIEERASPRVRTPLGNPQRAEKASPETPEIPKDFFGTPSVHERPPLRQYVNRKKLSLNSSSLLKGPNASSTPLSDKDSHSAIDKEETLLTDISKIGDENAEKPAKRIDHHHDSQNDSPKNVKKFRKSPVKKLSQDFQRFSQYSETLSSQDELMDSQELGRGKRKRVKNSFFGFDANNDSAPTEALSSEPCSSTTETKIATSSKVREDCTAQPVLTLPPILQESAEADLPRRERPRKQAFMSSESDVVRNTMERYRNDACYVQSRKSVDDSSNVHETIAEVHQASTEPDNMRLSGEMDLTRMKNNLKASLTHGRLAHMAEQENPNSKTVKLGGSDLPKSPDSGHKSGGNEFLDDSLESDGSHILTSPVPRGRGRPQNNTCAPIIPGSAVPAKGAAQERTLNVADVDITKSPVRRGRGRKHEVDTCAEPSSVAKSHDKNMKVNARSGSTIKPGQGHPPSKDNSSAISGPSTSKNFEVIFPEAGMSIQPPGDTQTRKEDLNNVPKSSVLPSRGRRRKENVALEPSSTNTGVVHSTAAAGPNENDHLQMRMEGRKGRRNKDLVCSQDSQPELSQDSQSSVASKNDIRTRGTRIPPLRSQGTVIPANTSERFPRKRGRRKLSAGSENLENQGAVDDENNQKKSIGNDEGRVTHEAPLEPKNAVAEKSAFPPQRGRGRARKPVACSTPVPEPDKEPSSSTSIMEPPNISNSRPNRRGFEGNHPFKQDELAKDSRPDPSSSSSKVSARKRGIDDTAKSAENINQSACTNKKLKVSIADENAEICDSVETTVIRDGPSRRSANRRGAKQIGNEDRVNESPGEYQLSSSIVSTIQRRGNRNATKPPQLLEDSDAEVPAEVKAESPCKTRGRPRKAVKNTADDFLPAPEELSATEVPSVSKVRGRRKKVVQGAAKHETHFQPATEEVSATEVPSTSKTRGRSKKAVEDTDAVEEECSISVPERVNPTDVPSISKARGRRLKEAVEESAEENGCSQDLSQGRRSGRARKKKESFDELMSRKEEEIRLKKLQQTAEQSPSPDKSHRSNLMTPSASVASISDESAFSIPASPASSISSKRSASRLATSTTESPPSSKKRKKEDLPLTPSSGQVKVMFTQLGDNKLSAMIKKLGGKVVEKPKDCTVLVTDKVKRTVKFLCALGLGKPIVSPNWISKSKAFSRFTDPIESLLKDNEGETKFDFELSSSLEKAKSQRLLEGYSVYTTSSILPPPKEMKPIIECSGGTFLPKPPAKWGPQSVVISDQKDKSEWPKLTKNGVTPPILSAEAILTGILQQQFDLEKHRLK